MNRPIIAFACALAVAALACAGLAQAQTYPSKPIRIIVPFPTGGGVDLAARIIGQKLNEALGRPVIVDNRTGAAGHIGTEIAARSVPDGYTLVMGSLGPLAIDPSLYPGLPYDPVKDFSPIALVASTIYALVVHPDVPAKSVEELIALAKANPGKLNYASSGTGTPPHLFMEHFMTSAGKMSHIPYKGAGPALTDLLGGQVQVFFADVIAIRPYLESSRLRALAVTSARRARTTPNLPTMAEAGLPGFVATSWTGVLAPAGTPQAIVTRLNAEIARVLPLPEIAASLGGDGSEFGKNTPDDFAAFMRSERARWRKVIDAAGVKLDR